MSETKIMLVLIAGAAGLAGGVVYLDPPKAPGPPVVVAPLTREQKADRHLAAADAASRRALDAGLEGVARVFGKGRAGARGFADEVLSLNGKWELAKSETTGLWDRLFGGQKSDPLNPFAGTPLGGEWSVKPTPDTSHEQYLKAEFARRVIDPDDLKRAITRAVEGYASELEAAENEMLVKLREDVFVGPGDADPAATARALGDEMRERLQQRAEAFGRDVLVTSGQQAATFGASLVVGNVVTDVALAAAAQMGISTSVLGVGGLSSVATLGVGVVVGIVVDQIIGYVLRQLGHDPADKVTATVVGSLDDLEAAVTTALRDELGRIQEARSKARRDIVTQMLAKGGAA